jgi:Mg-chelatase subunit ChlD
MARQPASTTKKTQAPAKGKTTRKAAAPTKPRTAGKGGAQPQPAPITAGGETRTKFTLFNLLGKERAYYLVDRVDVERPRQKVSKQSVAHSIIIIDRSGSMYSYLPDLKDTLVKLLTLDEYSQYDLVVTLISYSSQGDVAVHFEREPIQEIMKRESKPLKEIKKIQVTGLTCISQALEQAAKLVKDEELTCVTLHSDGYANHPSANAEAKTLDQLCTKLQERPVFVNTIAYTDYSDFRLLSKVANSVSGNCLKAGNIRQVYDSLYSTSKLLGSSVTPPLEIPLGDDYDYQVFVSHAGNKVNGSAEALRVRGLKEDHDAVVYKYKQLSEKEYKALKDVPERQTSEAVLAFARANLSEGNLNTSKYALASTYDSTLLERHGRALTNLQVAALAQDLETVLFQPAILQEHEVLDHVPVNRMISLLGLVQILAEHKDGYEVNLHHLKENYVRRGVRRIPGVRDKETGKVIEPTLKTEFTDAGDYARVSSYDINQNTANLNMLISRPVRLVPAGGGKPITEVAGIKLDKLSAFNNYTLVGDGELNVKEMKIRISDKKLFDRLVAEGVLEKDGQPAAKLEPKADYTLRLDILPLVPPFEGAVDLHGVFEELAELKTLSSICGAYLKEESDVYTEEQVAALRDHYLSKNLYVNFPTTTEYADRQKALAEGSLDTRVSYKIDIGNKTILNLSKIMSANKFLERMYELTDANGQKIDKPTFPDLLDPAVKVKHKQLSGRTKVTKADEFMKKLFDDFLAVAPNGAAAGVLHRVGAADLEKVVKSKKRPAKAEVAALTEARRKLDAYADGLFNEKVSPLVFYVGSTGVLPDEMDAKALTAEQITAKYPELTLSKDEQEGTFFELGDTLLSVYAKTEDFSR